MATILIVPGVGGSELYTPSSFFGLGPRIRVWLSYAAIAAGAWRWLALMPDGRTPSFPGVGLLQPGWMLEPYYGAAVSFFGARGYTVRAPQLFWPGTIESDAAIVAADIQSLAGEAPIHCLAHSRGGLVLRRALAILSASGQLGLVGRCAGLGVPHQGSWSAASLLSGFEQSLLRLGLLASLGPGGSLLTPILVQLREVIRTWPVSYELLPAPGAPGVPPAITAMLYSPTAWAAIGVDASAAWLAQADARWAASQPVTAAVEWIDVVGTGLPTPDQLLGFTPPKTGGAFSYSTAGDGTVPAAWATQPGRLSIATPTAHSALTSDGRVLDALDSYIRHGLSQSIVIGGGVLTG
ncbi:MAG: esterase/lipase family protein [Pseudonocardiaceae bacterium]